MKVICAWCEKEGKPALTGDQAPVEDEPVSHGICPFHAYHYRTRLKAGIRKVQVVEGQFRSDPAHPL